MKTIHQLYKKGIFLLEMKRRQESSAYINLNNPVHYFILI